MSLSGFGLGVLGSQNIISKRKEKKDWVIPSGYSMTKMLKTQLQEKDIGGYEVSWGVKDTLSCCCR